MSEARTLRRLEHVQKKRIHLPQKDMLRHVELAGGDCPDQNTPRQHMSRAIAPPGQT